MAEEGENEKIPEDAEYLRAVHAMENGDGNAKTKVAFYKLSGLAGMEVEQEEAVILLEERVKEGDCEAMWMLGMCCEYVIGVEQDIDRAQSLYDQSSHAGNAVGRFFVGKKDKGNMMMNIRGTSNEVKKRIYEMICIAPWTTLDLGCEYKYNDIYAKKQSN